MDDIFGMKVLNSLKKLIEQSPAYNFLQGSQL